MEYIRLSENYNINSLIPVSSSPYGFIKNKELPYFISMLKYNEEHFKIWKKTKSLKGISGGLTNKIWFDFDSHEELSLCFSDAVKCVKFLKTLDIPEECIQISFSGNKGIGLIIETDTDFTIEDIRAFCIGVYKELTLKTFDVKMYDHQRIFRLVFTKHEKTARYKIPLSLEELELQNIPQILSFAESLEHFNIDDTLAYYQPYKVTKKLTDKINSYKTLSLKKDKTNLSPIADNFIDYSNKPKDWRNCKWAILQGHFAGGERHQALTIIAATARGLGYDRETAYYLCKSAIKKQARLHSQEEFDTDEVWENILESIYAPDWKGGQYSCKTDLWLQNYCEHLGVHKCQNDKAVNPTIQIEEAYGLFKDYAENIDKLTIKTGINPIDHNLRMTIGMLVGLVAPAGVGKCLGKGTPILMYDGTIKNVEDIHSGDLLMGDDSTPRKVLSTCRGQENLYEVQQETGMNYVVNESHILSLKGSWKTNNKRLKYIQYGNIVDIEVKEYLNKSKQFKQYMKGYRVPIEFPESNLELSPYFLGYWIGDGTTDKCEITFGKTDINHIKWFEKFALENNCFVTKYQDRECMRLNFSGARGDNIVANNLPSNKTIPEKYLVNSRKNRLELLAGIIDSDGHYNKSRNIYEIITKYEELANQIQNLASLLGFRSKISLSEKYCIYKNEKRTGLYYRVIIKGNNLYEIPCKIERKISRPIEQQRHYDLSKVEVVSKGVGDYYGFEIDGNKRFVLKDGTVTHNTSISLQVLNTMSKNDELCCFFSFDMFHALVFQKLVQKHFQVDPEHIFDSFKANPEYGQQVIELLQQEYKNVEFCFDAGQTPDQIAQTIKMVEEKRGKKVRFIVIDYNELVLSDKSDPTAASAYVIQKLREIANTQNLCVLVLLQPNKISGNPSEEINSYHAAKGSSAISQAVSIMLGVNRPGYDPKYPEDDKFITVNCLKNRMGKLFSVDLHWNGLTGTVRELTVEEKGHLRNVLARKEEEKNKKGGGWIE